MDDYIPTDLDNRILFSDNHLLAVNKPGGILTQSSGKNAFNLEDWSREWVRKEKKKSGAIYLHAVHRLDRQVSGVVLFARTSKALSRLNTSIKKNNCKKIYHAWVEGVPSQREATLRNYLIHGHHRAEIVMKDTNQSKLAILHYKLLQSENKYSLLRIELVSGRYHQIRAQLGALGHPIKGDSKYGANTSHNTIGLHHKKLIIQHPVRQNVVTIKAPLTSLAK
tara:strand:- start:167 stop:835 length:669 start_codon:yes stop_codon:yes gene_type:complete